MSYLLIQVLQWDAGHSEQIVLSALFALGADGDEIPVLLETV